MDASRTDGGLSWSPGPPDRERTLTGLGAADAVAALVLVLLWPELRWWVFAIGGLLGAGQAVGLRMLGVRHAGLVVRVELEPAPGTARFALHSGETVTVPLAAVERIGLTHRGERDGLRTRSDAAFALRPAPGRPGTLRTARTVLPDGAGAALEAFARANGVRFHEEERLPRD
ncbi:hypothetical protein KNE206_04970 [Kitasatospora sp. NE20-6]|uniref:hypothetical protein n=1 Tax=Kitasatospora sp. NE20-6 TaxID=2859066 RepID=UPI0034DCB68C